MRAIDADHLKRWILSRVFKSQLSVADVVDQIDREDTIEPEPQIIHCNRCKHYQGVHKVQGHAPCNYWGTGAVLWNEYCSNAEPYQEGVE